MSQARQALRLRAEVPAEVPHTAMIMAAGLGKRMRPLTATRPKPLIEVGGKALLDHVLEKLRAAGVRKVVVNVHYLADALTPTLGRGAAHDAAAEATREARQSGRALREVLAERTDVDVAVLLDGSLDSGEAGAQVDAVLADHRRLTEGTPA